MENNNKTYCDVCGDCLTVELPEQPTMGFVKTMIGITLTPYSNNKPEHPEISKVRKEFGRTNFDICYCCWLRSLGFKPNP